LYHQTLSMILLALIDNLQTNIEHYVTTDFLILVHYRRFLLTYLRKFVMHPRVSWLFCRSLHVMTTVMAMRRKPVATEPSCRQEHCLMVSLSESSDMQNQQEIFSYTHLNGSKQLELDALRDGKPVEAVHFIALCLSSVHCRNFHCLSLV